MKRFTAIEQQLDTLYHGKEPLGGDAFVFMQKDKVNRMNSVLLHELYFDGLTPKSSDPAEDIRRGPRKKIWFARPLDRGFQDLLHGGQWLGSVRTGRSHGRLYNVSSDLHEVGVVSLGQPLVVCDVYEHAFYVDYTNRKQEYVNQFVQFIDRTETNARFHAVAG